MSVQLLDKTRKINKLLHNNNSSKVVFNDICEVLTEILDSNVLVVSKKGKVLGKSKCEEVPYIQELIVSGNPVSDFSPLAACPDLWSVDAGDTALTDLNSFAGFPSLYRLYLREVPGLGDISSLERTPVNTLFLQPVTQQQLAAIGGLPQLRSLFLWVVEGMEDFSALSGLSGLEYLYVHSRNGVERKPTSKPRGPRKKK